MTSIIVAINSIIAGGLASLNIQPSAYQFMFPTEISLGQIQEMIDQGIFPTVEGLAPAFTCTILLSLVRFILHHTVFKPLAETTMKIKETPLVKIADIDNAFPKAGKYVQSDDVKKYCADSGRKTLDVKKYLWTRRRNSVTSGKIIKYVEALWRFIFYTTFCVLGYYALFVPDTAVWLSDSWLNWTNWPLHPLTASMAFYYQVELGCYIHQLLWTEVSRSDALEMIAHHIITIVLIIASFLTNYTRVGTTILLLHDLADIVLEGAKVLNYIANAKGNKWLKLTVDILFGVFAVTFFVTRLVLYPRYILYSVIVEGVATFGCEFGGCFIFIGLLCALQCLHIFWFYLIMRMVFKLIANGGIEKDERSDDEEDIAAEFSELDYDEAGKEDDAKKGKKNKDKDSKKKN